MSGVTADDASDTRDGTQPGRGSRPGLVLLGIAVASVIAGVGRGMLIGTGYESAYVNLWAVVMPCLAVAWYRCDARRRGYPESFPMRFMVFALAMIAIPLYLLRSRGVLKGTVATILGLLFVFGCFLLAGTGFAVSADPAHL